MGRRPEAAKGYTRVKVAMPVRRAAPIKPLSLTKTCVASDEKYAFNCLQALKQLVAGGDGRRGDSR